MDEERAQVEAKPLIEVDLGDNGGGLSFGSIKHAQDWIDREIRVWEGFSTGLSLGEASRPIMERQLQLPREIQDSLAQARQLEDTEQAGLVQRVQDLLARYAEYGSVCSRSELGKAISHLQQSGRGPVGLGALASALGIPAAKIAELPKLDQGRLAMVLAGYLVGTTFNVVNWSDLPEYQSRMEEQLDTLDGIVRQTQQERKEFTEQGKAANAEVSEYVRNQRDSWGEFFRSAKGDYDGLKRAYEEQLRLQAPATYWRKRAEVTSLAAKFALVFFAAGAIFLAWAVVEHGPSLLARLAEVGEVDSLGTLAMLSIPTLTVLWVLRQIARLFVTNLESSADAKLRETMATTYLALAKEGTGSVGEKERLMVLEALFRPPAPHNADDGHFGGALEILTRRNSNP